MFAFCSLVVVLLASYPQIIDFLCVGSRSPLDAAAAAKAPLLLGGLSHQIFQLLSAHGLGAKDFSVVFKFLQEQAAAAQKK